MLTSLLSHISLLSYLLIVIKPNLNRSGYQKISSCVSNIFSKLSSSSTKFYQFHISSKFLCLPLFSSTIFESQLKMENSSQSSSNSNITKSYITSIQLASVNIEDQEIVSNDSSNYINDRIKETESLIFGLVRLDIEWWRNLLSSSIRIKDDNAKAVFTKQLPESYTESNNYLNKNFDKSLKTLNSTENLSDKKTCNSSTSDSYYYPFVKIGMLKSFAFKQIPFQEFSEPYLDCHLTVSELTILRRMFAIAAATVIQKHFRGFLQRKIFQPQIITFRQLKKENEAAIIIQKNWRGIKGRELYEFELLVQKILHDRLQSAITIQKFWRRWKAQQVFEFEYLTNILMKLRSLAATQIQKIWRGHKTRQAIDSESKDWIIKWTWNSPGTIVEVVGEFSNPTWTKRHLMTYCHIRKCFILKLPRKVGQHELKFIVDGRYICDGGESIVLDGAGHYNNLVTVNEPEEPPFHRIRASLKRIMKANHNNHQININETLISSTNSREIKKNQTVNFQENDKNYNLNDNGFISLNNFNNPINKTPLSYDSTRSSLSTTDFDINSSESATTYKFLLNNNISTKLGDEKDIEKYRSSSSINPKLFCSNFAKPTNNISHINDLYTNSHPSKYYLQSELQMNDHNIEDENILASYNNFTPLNQNSNNKPHEDHFDQVQLITYNNNIENLNQNLSNQINTTNITTIETTPNNAKELFYFTDKFKKKKDWRKRKK